MLINKSIRIQILDEEWALASYIGEARRRSNENKRNAIRDRGNEKNIHIDQLGTLGEILALRIFKDYFSHEQYLKQEHSLFNLNGGGKQVGSDLFLDKENLNLDVKTFDCAKNKKYFAINEAKHRKLSGYCDGYTCILIPKDINNKERFPKEAHFIYMVPYSDVEYWTSTDLANHNDPSKNIHINSFISKYIQDSSLNLNKIRNVDYFTRDEIYLKIKDNDLRLNLHSKCPEIAIILKKK